MGRLGLNAVAALGSASVRAQPLYCSRWLDITTYQSPSGLGRHGLAQTGETPDLRHAKSFGRDAQAAPCARSRREARWRSLGPSSIPSLGDGVMLKRGVDRLREPTRRAALLLPRLPQRSMEAQPCESRRDRRFRMPRRQCCDRELENSPRSWCPTWLAIRGLPEPTRTGFWRGCGRCEAT